MEIMHSNATLVLAAGSGIALGWILRTFMVQTRGRLLSHRSSSIPRSIGSRSTSGSGDWSDEDEGVAISDDGEYKMVIVVRTDLRMGKGKIAAQCCHAACGSVKKLRKMNPDVLKMWEFCGQPKIVTKANDEKTLTDLAQKANSLGLVSQVIRDAGRTQIAPGSLTALAVGPGPNELVDHVTGSLKLL